MLDSVGGSWRSYEHGERGKYLRKTRLTGETERRIHSGKVFRRSLSAGPNLNLSSDSDLDHSNVQYDTLQTNNKYKH